jgi:hypothetical protein
MNPNHKNSWINYLQNSINPPISNQQNTSYFGNAHLNPNPNHNPNFQNSFFIPNPQNNPQFGNYPYPTPYPYQHPQFPSQSTNPTMPYGVQMSRSGAQSNGQELETPPFCTQGGLDTINLGEDVGSTPVVNTPKVRFQSREGKVFGRGLVKLITSIGTRIT